MYDMRKLPLFGGFCSEAGDDEDCTNQPHCNKVNPYNPGQSEEVFDQVVVIIAMGPGA